MIIRDKYGIIVQHDKTNPLYKDGGDSAARTGIATMVGLVNYNWLGIQAFEVGNGILVRHPIQAPYNNPNSFSRDQLLQFVGGLRDVKMAKRIFWSRVRAGFLAQNKLDIDLKPKKWYDRDILTPSHMGHLLRAAQIYWLYPLLVISYAWLLIDILWSTKVMPYQESNQIICMCSVAGKWALKLYCWLHPDFRAPIKKYWGEWRDQAEIGDAIIKFIEEKIK